MTEFCRYRLLSPDSVSSNEDLVDGLNSEDGNRRIKSLLADWLRMENVVVLTGAGSSVSAGGRLMGGPNDRNLEYLVLETIRHCQISIESKSIIEWKIQNDIGNGNFENWLSYLFNANSIVTPESPINSIRWKQSQVDQITTAMASQTNHSLDNESSNQQLVESSKKIKQKESDNLIINEDVLELQKFIECAIFCECALNLNIAENSDSIVNTESGHVPFLAKLIARDPNLGRTHLFTLNYDTLFEQALEELSIQYFDGFSGKSFARFDPSIYGLDLYFPGDVSEGRVRRFDKFLKFYKLHGSIHWYFENGICKSQHPDLSSFEKYRKSSPEDKAKKLKSMVDNGFRSFGILPTSLKFSQTLEMPYSHLFRLFHDRLCQPQTFLIVLGYGFGDDHVTRIIETALTNPSLVMLVIEPFPDSSIVHRIKRYQGMGKRAFVLTKRDEAEDEVATFSDFAKRIMPDVKWLEDFKRMRKFENEIRQVDANKISEVLSQLK